MTTSFTLLPETELETPLAAEGGFGALSTPQGNLPLRQMHVQARINGLLSEVTLRQTFVNTLQVPVEATYVFPLPDRAAVSQFKLVVGERTVEGELQERGQARRTYDSAIKQGHRAAIAEEDRSGVFSMRVGNLMPGDEASVFLTLGGPLPFSGDEASFRFPLVVAPRYIPGRTLSGEQTGLGVQFDTEAVPDASRISPPVLLPGCPNPIDLSLSVEIADSGLELGTIRSSLHAITTRHTDGRVRVELKPGERLNRDFVLRIQLGTARKQTSLVTVADPQEPGTGTFMLTLLPPTDAAHQPAPRDVVFVLDRSGSMEGWKMVAARRATARMLDTLNEQDRFTVLAFDDSIETPRGLPRGILHPASDRNRFRAVEFLATIEARGGTDMGAPLRDAALEFADDTDRDRVVVLVTDGQVGNEDQILRALAPALQGVRIFSLGIDRAVNAGFLRRLAGLGGGGCELVESEDRLDEVMEHVHRQIATPILAGISVAPAEGELLGDTLVPTRLPDLFQGAPLTIQGRFQGVRPEALRLQVKGRLGGLEVSETVGASASSDRVVEQAWARGLIRQLEDRRLTIGHSTGFDTQQSLQARIVTTSLRHSVLSRFTAFVAVDRAEVVNEGGQQHEVIQAVETPDGWAKDQTGAFPVPLGLEEEDDMLQLYDSSAELASFEASDLSSLSDPFGQPELAEPFFGSPAGSGFGGLAGGGAPMGSAPMGADPFAGPVGGDPFAPKADQAFPSSDPFGGGHGDDPFLPAPGATWGRSLPSRADSGEDFEPMADSLDDISFKSQRGDDPAPEILDMDLRAKRVSDFDSGDALRKTPPPAASAPPPPPRSAPGAPMARMGRFESRSPAPEERKAEEASGELQQPPKSAKKRKAARGQSASKPRSSRGRSGSKQEEAKSNQGAKKPSGLFSRLREVFRGTPKPGDLSRLEVARRCLIAVHRVLEAVVSQPVAQRLSALRGEASELRRLLVELKSAGAAVPERLRDALAHALDQLETAPASPSDLEAERLWNQTREALRALRKVLAPSDAGGTVIDT